MTRAAGAATALAAAFLLSAAAARAALPDDMAAARQAYEAGDVERARLDFLEIARKHGDDSQGRDAWYYLALLSRAGEDYVHYLDLYLENGGRKDRRGPYAELRAGRYYYAAGDYRNALTRFETARELRRDDAVATAEARYWVGLTLMALREPGEARRALEEASMPRSPEATREAALFALGELFRTSRDYGGAARAFAQYREAFPKGNFVAAALFGEASARDLLGRKKEATELFSDIVTHYPGNPEAAQARQWLRAAEPKPAVPPAPAAVTASAPPGEESPDTNAAPESPAAPLPEGYSVQVGAFAAEDNAMKLADDLIARGYTRVRIEKGTERPELFHVRFGSYPDGSRAERAGEEVSATLGLDFQIVPPGDGNDR